MIQSYLIKNAHLEEHSVKTGCQLFLLEASKLVLVLRWQTGLIELSLFVFFSFSPFFFTITPDSANSSFMLSMHWTLFVSISPDNHRYVSKITLLSLLV